MFRIRTEHRASFRQSALAGFCERVLLHVRQFYPREAAPFSDQAIIDRAEQCIDRAKKYGLISEKQVFCFIDVTFLTGVDFDSQTEHEWARHILTSREVNADQRAGALLGMAFALRQRGFGLAREAAHG